MRKINRGASLFVIVLVVVVIGGMTFTGIALGLSCDGTCASVTCSETAPCTFNGATYTIGTACAPGVVGTVCKAHWWPFADCLCANAIGQGNVLRAQCVK